MIKANIYIKDLILDPVLRENSLFLEGSCISCYSHEAVDRRLFCSDRRWFLWVFEKSRLLQPIFCSEANIGYSHYTSIYQQCSSWPLDYVIVEVLQSERRIKIKVGRMGVAPIYYFFNCGCLTISWDIEDFRRITNLLADYNVVRYLSMQTFYSSSQILAGVYVLTERSYIEISNGNIRYKYPEAAPSAKPIRQINPAFVDGHLDRLMKEFISRRSTDQERICAEFSGGVDSTLVASYLKRKRFDVRSISILLDKKNNSAQRLRIEDVNRANSFSNSYVQMEDYLPDFDLNSSAAPHLLNLDEFYNEAFFALWDAAAQAGCRFIYRGFGGDELAPIFSHDNHLLKHAENSNLSPPYSGATEILSKQYSIIKDSFSSFDAPKSLIPETTLLAIAASARPSLKFGLWPIYPLSDPEIVHFCHSLPFELRQDKSFLRVFACRMLERNVFPQNYTKESFSYVLPLAISTQGAKLKNQLKSCALADLGYVDFDKIDILLDSVIDKRDPTLSGYLANFLLLERFARQVV